MTLEDIVLLPEELPPLIAFGLMALSLCTSAFTAAFGIGGGMILLGVMGLIVPSSALVPIHGCVQAGSNAGRALLFIQSANTQRLAWFLPGALLGVVIGGLIVIELPASVLRGSVGAFVVLTAWKKFTFPFGASRWFLLVGGLLSSMLTMFVGATGPFVVALFRQSKLGPEPLIATVAVAMVAQHFLKVSAFCILGYNLTPWLVFILAMIGFGFVGTIIGRSLFKRIPPTGFDFGLKVVLTIVGSALIVGAIKPN